MNKTNTITSVLILLYLYNTPDQLTVQGQYAKLWHCTHAAIGVPCVWSWPALRYEDGILAGARIIIFSQGKYSRCLSATVRGAPFSPLPFAVMPLTDEDYFLYWAAVVGLF